VEVCGRLQAGGGRGRGNEWSWGWAGGIDGRREGGSCCGAWGDVTGGGLEGWDEVSLERQAADNLNTIEEEGYEVDDGIGEKDMLVAVWI
jgi:hypothetical protein